MQFELFRQRSVSFDISKHELKYKIHIRLTISLQKYNFKLAIFSHLTIYFSQLIIYFSQATIHLWPGNYFLNLQFMTRPDHLLSWSLQLKDANTGESKDFQVYLKIYHPWFSSLCIFPSTEATILSTLKGWDLLAVFFWMVYCIFSEIV